MRFRPRAQLKQFHALESKFLQLFKEADKRGDLVGTENINRSFLTTERIGKLLSNSKVPYIKIWPEMLNCLRTVRLDIPTESLPRDVPPVEILIPDEYRWCGSPHEPFAEFELNSVVIDLLPGDWLEDTVSRENGPLTSETSGTIAEDAVRESLCISAFCSSQEGTSAQLQLFEYGKTVEEKLSLMEDEGSSANFRELLAVGISAILFISDEHELLTPELAAPVVERGRGKKRRKALKQLDQQKQQLAGWSLATSSEKEVPAPTRIGDPAATDTGEGGGKHRYQSQTRAHMRLQPCGPGLKDRKLVFIESFTRGKHLPKRDIRGFRIPDKILKGR